MGQFTLRKGLKILLKHLIILVTGEAEYAADIPLVQGELHGVFVQSTHANANIDQIDASAALAVPGVVTFVSAEDIVGDNTFVSPPSKPEKVKSSSIVYGFLDFALRWL